MSDPILIDALASCEFEDFLHSGPHEVTSLAARPTTPAACARERMIPGMVKLMRAHWRTVGADVAQSLVATGAGLRDAAAAATPIEAAVRRAEPRLRKLVHDYLLATMSEAGKGVIAEARKRGTFVTHPRRGRALPRAAYSPDQPRDELGRWIGGDVPEHVVGTLREHGVTISKKGDSRGDVMARGGAAYMKYQGKIVVSKGSSKFDVIHEAGHAYDHAMASKTPINERGIAERQKYWSDTGLKKTLAEDYKAARPGRNTPSWEDKRAAWSYAFSSTQEAFAHIFAAIHGDDTRIGGVFGKAGSGFSIKDVMPRSYAAVERLLGKRSHLRALAGIDMTFDLTSPRAIAFAAARSSEMVTEVEDATIEGLKAWIARAMEQGIAPRELAREIVDLIGLRSDQMDTLDKFVAEGATLEQEAAYAEQLLNQRALLIARTETGRSANNGTRETWLQAQDSGLLSGEAKRIWIGHDDGRERDSHIYMNDQEVGIDEPFISEDGEPIEPGEEPNCRCDQGISDAPPVTDEELAQAPIDEGDVTDEESD